jgi:hypothetical protein
MRIWEEMLTAYSKGRISSMDGTEEDHGSLILIWISSCESIKIKITQ